MPRLRSFLGSFASNPTPTVAGLTYFNTTVGLMMVYDGVRSKWLSIAEAQIPFGRNGNTAAGAYYRMNRLAMSATRGRYAEFDGTIVSLAYTRDDVDAATFEVVRDGTLITGAVLASSAVAGNDQTLNADFAANGVLAVRNQAGGNTTNDVFGYVRMRWRT